MATYQREKTPCEAAALTKQLQTAGLPVTGVSTADPAVWVNTSADLTAEQEATMDATITAHDGAALIPSAALVASSKLGSGSTSLLGSALGSPVTVDGCVSAPSSLIDPLSKALVTIVGEYKSDGQIAIKIVERQGNGTETTLHTAVPTLPSTSGVWTPFLKTTDIAPNGGLNSYRLDAYLDGAVLAEIRFVNISLRKNP